MTTSPNQQGVNDWATALGQSLDRAMPNILLFMYTEHRYGSSGLWVVFHLKEQLTRAILKALRNYVEEDAKANGWRVAKQRTGLSQISFLIGSNGSRPTSS